MAVETIKVRKKSNHNITRMIRVNALSTFERRGWEQVPGQSISVASLPKESKKKDAEPVGAPAETGDAEIVEQGAEEVSPNPFSWVDGDDERIEGPLDSLRDQYQKLSGKAADKRWKEERLNDEISKLTNGN